MLINKLIYSAITQGKPKILGRIREDMVSPKDFKLIDACRAFQAKHKSLPSVDAFETTTGVSLKENEDAPEVWVEEIEKRYKTKVIEDAIIASAKDKDSAVRIFQDAIVKANADHSFRVSGYGDNPLSRYDEYVKRKGTNGITYLSTGLPELDELTFGYKEADLWVFGGTEGVGKSWILLNLINFLDNSDRGGHKNKPLLYVSCEMPISECEERLDAINAGISYNDYIAGKLSKNDERRLYQRLRTKESKIIMVDDCASFSDVKSYMALYSPAICYIDGAHLLAKDYDWTEVSKMTADMKLNARIHQIPTIVTTHLKSGKGRNPDGGSVDDFAYSKSFPRDSDIVSVLIKPAEFAFENKIGIDMVKLRRKKEHRVVIKLDPKSLEMNIIETINLTEEILDTEDDNPLAI